MFQLGEFIKMKEEDFKVRETCEGEVRVEGGE